MKGWDGMMSLMIYDESFFFGILYSGIVLVSILCCCILVGRCVGLPERVSLNVRDEARTGWDIVHGSW